ncbi:tail fiber domain-containing protein [Nostoc sp.]|uniref:tail fiber domain-containing protein n=1 Tax=Nostoc sp. TaxID=1180 RepID=UPI002FF50411
MSRDESFDSIQLQFGNLEVDWPTLKANQAKQLFLENADFKLATNKTIIFGGNGQISAVGDLSFLTAGNSTVPALTIFANGNIGIGTGTRQPTDKLEIAGSLKLETGLSVNQFSGDITDSDQVVPTAKAVKTYVDSKASPELPDGSVTDRKIANDAITTDKIANNSIIATKIQNGAITKDKLDPSISLKIPDGSVDTAQLANSAITSDKIADKSITAAKLNFSIGSQWQGTDGSPISYTKGNVGIGTASPASKLHVVDGNIRVDNGEYQSWGSITFHPDVDKSGDGIINFLNSNGSENMRIDANGNVGIGTIKPEAKLHVQMNFPDSPYGGNIKLFRTSGKGNDFSYDGGDDGIFAFTNYGKDSGKTQFLWQKPDDSGIELLTIFNSGRVEADIHNRSSRELKENITNLSTEEAIETLANLNPAKFYYRQDEEKKLRVGFIAEDVPELLATQDRRAISALDIVAVLTKVIQQQQEELSFLKERLNALEAKA